MTDKGVKKKKHVVTNNIIDFYLTKMEYIFANEKKNIK